MFGRMAADTTDAAAPAASRRRPGRRLVHLASRDFRSPEAAGQSGEAARPCPTAAGADAAGRVGIAGTADVPGAFGSSILSLMLGGTMRPGAGAGLDGGGGGAAAVGGTGRAAAGGSTAGGAGGSSTTAPARACSPSGGSRGGGRFSDRRRHFLRLFDRLDGGGSSVNRLFDGRRSAGAAGFAVLTSRGGASVGAAGFAGSGFLALAAGFLAPGFAAGPSANMSPPGSVMLRSRARRSTNCRATTSSIVLDALFSSMPCARFSSASTSWLLVLRSSATL